MSTTLKPKTLSERILAVQSEIGKLSKDLENPYFKSKYFDINQVVEALLPLLLKHGITVTQPLTHITAHKDPYVSEIVPAIETIIEGNGEERKYQFPMPKKEKAQEVGAQITYFRRYCLQSYFLLQAEDDDGKLKIARGKTSPAQTTAQKYTKALAMIKTMKKGQIEKANTNIGVSKIYTDRQKADLITAITVRAEQLK